MSSTISQSKAILSFWEKDFDQAIEKHIDFLKENLEFQNEYSSKFSEILQEMEIFQNENNEEENNENQEDSQNKINCNNKSKTEIMNKIIDKYENIQTNN